MPPPEGDEEVKEGKGLEILTLLFNLVINELSILLAQINA